MLGPVLIRHLADRPRLRRFIQDAVDLTLRVGIKHEELLEVRARVTQQLQAILFGPGKRLLVPVHSACRVILYRAEADESLAHKVLPRIGDTKLLKVSEQARIFFGYENTA